MSCSVNPNAHKVAIELCKIFPSVNLDAGVVNQLIEQGIEGGYFSRDDVEDFENNKDDKKILILDAIQQLLNDQIDVDADFDTLTPVILKNTEKFDGENARAMRASHYIGVDKQDAKFKVKMRQAMESSGRTVVTDNTILDEDAVALVELTTDSDLDAVLRLCEKVLDAGGRLLFPTSKEVSDYVNGIKDSNKREAYINMRLAMQKALVDRGYSAREVKEEGGLKAQVVQLTKIQSFEKIELDKDVVAAKTKALNDNADVKEVAKKAKKMNIRVAKAFTNKEGASNKDERVKAPTLYEALRAGEVNAIVREDTENNKYSTLQKGDIIPLRQDADHILYVEVINVTQASKSEYIDMLNNGDIVSGFSVQSAREIKDDATYNVIQVKSLVEGGKQKKERTKKKTKGTKSGKSGKTLYRTRCRYDKKKKRMVYWKEPVTVSANDKETMKLYDLISSVYKAQMAALKQMGIPVEIEDTKKVEKKLKEATQNTVTKQLEKASKEDRDKILKEMGEGLDKEVITTPHQFVYGSQERHSLLTDLFKGNYARMNQFGKSLMQYFRYAAEGAIIEKKLNEYRQEVARLNELIEIGLNEDGKYALRSETNDYKSKVAVLNEKISRLENDGWLGAVTISDVLTETLNAVRSEMRYAVQIKDYIAKESKEGGKLFGKTGKEQVRIVSEAFGKKNITAWNYYSFVKADRAQPFLDELFDGYLDEQLVELKRPEGVDDETWKRRVAQRNAEIAEKRKRSDATFDELWDRVGKEIQKATGVPVTLKVRVNGIKSTATSNKRENAEGEENTNSESEIEKEEESDRDVQMVANAERDVTSSLSQKMKRLLASQFDWDVKRYEFTGSEEERERQADEKEAIVKSHNYTYEIVRDGKGKALYYNVYTPSKDAMFFQAKAVPFGVAFGRLMSILNETNGGVGLRNGEELYQYLKNRMEQVTWYHGLVKEMDNDPSIKTALFTAMKKRHMNFRSLAEKGNKNSEDSYDEKETHSNHINRAENYDESAEFVNAQMQETQNHGLIIERGEIKGVKVEINKPKCDSAFAEFRGKTFKNDGVVLEDISLYDNTGHYNRGTVIGDEYDNGYGKVITQVTKLTGAAGFVALVESLPISIKNPMTLLIDDTNSDLHKIYHALRAVGLDISRDQMDLAFFAKPYKIIDCIKALRKIANLADPFNYKDKVANGALTNGGITTRMLSDFLSGAMTDLSETMSSVSDMQPESSHRWGDKTYYTWANPTLIDEVINELANCESEEDFMKYVNDRFLHSDNKEIDSSFFMTRNAEGKVIVSNTWLRNMIPASNSEKDIKKAQYYRRMFKLGYFANHGLPGPRPGTLRDYEHMTEQDKVAIETLNYFSPKAGRHGLSETAGAGLDQYVNGNVAQGRIDHKAACYNFPIMADSPNHIFYGARRYTALRNEDGTTAEGFSLDSHAKDTLLDGCADVVMQEYFRIKVFKSNAKGDKELSRPQMSKAFDKNKDKFCNFPDLNNVKVRITYSEKSGKDPEEKTFIEAIEELSTTGSAETLVASVEVSKDNEQWHRVSKTTNVKLYRDMIMEAVHKCCLNDSLQRSIAEWERVGAVSEDVMQSEDSTFSDAFAQNRDREGGVNALLSELFGKAVDIVKNSDGSFSVKNHTEEGDSAVMTAFNQTPLSSAIWDEIENYTDFDFGINKGDLAQFILGSTDKYFNMGLYKMNEQQREAEEVRQSVIVASIVNILQKYDKNEKSALHKYVAQLSKDPNKISLQYRNLLIEALQDYAWNKTFAKTQILQLTVGDIAQFKNEGDLSKRYKGVVGAYERVDMTAVDTRHGNRPVKEYYGETKIEDPKWQENQKTIIISDFQATKEEGSDSIKGFHNISNFFNDVLLPKLQQDLEAGVIDEATYAEYCDGYAGMNIADGQSFRTIQSMKKLCDFLHLNTAGMDEIYQAVIDGKKLSWEQIRDYIQQMKTFSFGFEQAVIDYSERGYGENAGVTQLKKYAQQITSFVKDSQYSLMLYSEEMAAYLGGKSSILQGLYDFSVENQTDVVHFQSTQKTAATRMVDLSKCRDAADVIRTLNAAKKAGEEDPNKSIFHAESWDYVGRQISTKPHLFDEEQGIGSQLSKLIEADMTDTYETSAVNPETGEVEKKTYKTEVVLRDKDGNPKAKLTPQQFSELLTRVQITNMREDLLALEKQLGSKEAFAKLLLDQLYRTDKYPEDLLEAIKYNPDTEDFVLSLDNPTIINAIQPIVASLVRKRVVKQKTKGGTAIQCSSVGRTENLKEVWGETEDGQKYVKYVECMLPAWSKKLFRAFADKEGNIDINNIPVEMREMVGYRVPTEHLYSAVPLRVVGFLNQEQGSSILLPQEIVVWSGSDFDIDKMYLMLKDFNIVGDKEILSAAPQKAWEEFYMTPDGMKYRGICEDLWRKAVEEYIINNNLAGEERERFEHLIKHGDTKKWTEFRKKYCELAGKGKGRLFDILPLFKNDVDERFSIENLRHDFAAFCEREGMTEHKVRYTDVANPADIAGRPAEEWQSALESASRMDRDNMLVSMYFARLTCPQTLMMINQPGGYAKQAKLSKIVTILSSGNPTGLSFKELSALSLEELSNMADEYAPRMDIMDACTDDIMFERNMTGKQMVAISALHNAFHAAIQKAPINLTQEFVDRFGFTLNGIPMRTRLGEVYDESGRFILRNIGGFVAASTDNAKDPVIGYLNLNQQTAEYWFTLMHMGYSLETVALLMNQPAVKKAFRELGRFTAEDFENVEFDDSKQIDMTHDEMANEMAIMSDDLSLDDMLKSDIQKRAISIIMRCQSINRSIKAAMSCVKITQPKNSFANSFGETWERMRAIKTKLSYNRTQNGKDSIDVFDRNEFNDIVLDKFDRDDDTPMTVDEYLKGVMTPDGKLRKPRLPMVQACYDYGFVRPLRYLSKYIGAYGKDTISLLERLENYDGGGHQLNAYTINKLINHRRLFSTLPFLCQEELESNARLESVDDVRRAYLTSFPQYFQNLIKNYNETGTADGVKQDGMQPRNLTQEFAILSHILYKVKKLSNGGNISVLLFSKRGKVDKMVQNELVTSWAMMAKDSDPIVRNLALQLYKYSMFYNGASFAPNAFGGYAPACILHEFPEYDAALRNLQYSMTLEDRELFLDQFIRNNAYMFEGHPKGGQGIIPWVQADTKLVEELFTKETKQVGYDKQKSWKPKEGDHYLPQGAGVPRDARYFYMVAPDGKHHYFRREKDSSGDDYWINVEQLGYSQFPEYDSEHDLVKNRRIGSWSIKAVAESMQANLIANEKEIEEKRIQQAQNDILNSLAELSSQISDDRSEGMGNDSSAYIWNGERHMRTHDYMRDVLHIGETSIPVDKETGKPKFSQKQWDRLSEIGRTIGSVFDTYARLWFKRKTYGALSASDQALMDSLFDKERGPLAQKKILVRGDINEGSLENALSKICSSIASQFPGAKFYTELNGKPIRICNEVMTKNGPVKVGGELDMLVANPDGTFTIVDFKQMNMRNISYYFEDSNKIYDKEGGITYRDHAVQLNCYRSILKSLFPNMEINLCIAPFLTDRGFKQIDLRGNVNWNNKRISENADEEATINSVVTNTKAPLGMIGARTVVIDMVSDDKLSGIPDPKKTTAQEKEEKAEEQQKEIEANEEVASPAGNGEITSYADIFAQYLTPEQMSQQAYLQLYNYLDGKEAPQYRDAAGGYEERRRKGYLESLLKRRKKTGNLVFGSMIEKEAFILFKTKGYDYTPLSSEVIEQIVNSIIQHKDVLGDDDVQVC